MRILIVDDSHSVRVTLALNLELEDHQVRAVSTVEEGLDLAISWKPSVAILDVMILGFGGVAGGGLQLLRRIKRADRMLPVVMLSGEEGERSRKAAEWFGASAYLSKKATVPEILKILREVARK